MSGISANVRDAVNAINALRSTQIPAFRKELMSQLALEALKIMTPLTPINTGDLRRSETIERIGEDQYEIGPHLFYAPYVFLGTPPHMIYPVNAKALYWKGAAHPVPFVHHPGYKGNPVHEKTYFELVSRAPVIAGALARRMVVFP